MMKKLAVAFAVLAAAGIGGHYFLWTKQVQSIAANLERIGKEGMADGQASFTYDAKEVSGYPMQAMVRYVKPKITITAPAHAEDEAAGVTPVSVESVVVQGDLSIGHGVVQSQGKIALTGALEIKGKDEDVPFAYRSAWKDAAGCDIALTDSAASFLGGNSPIQTAKTPQEFLRALASLQCSAKELVITDLVKNKEIASIGAQHFTLNSAPSTQTGQHKVGIDFGLKDATFAATSNPLEGVQLAALGNDADTAASIKTLLDKHPIAWFDASLAGKQNMMFKGEYEGSIDAPTPPFRVSVSDLSISNNFYTMSWPFSVAIAGNNNITVQHNGEMIHTEAFDKVARDSITALLAIVQDETLPVAPAMQEKLKMLNPDAVYGVLPPLAPAGKITTQANFSVAGEAAKTITIDSVGLNNALFGVSAKGMGQIGAGSTNINGDIVFTQSDVFITRLAHYVNDITSIMATIEGRPQKVMVTEAAAKAVVDFLNEFDTDASPDTTTIKLTTAEDQKLLISGKEFGMVMIEGLSKLAPHFQHLMPQ
jgi:hypothetical protein